MNHADKRLPPKQPLKPHNQTHTENHLNIPRKPSKHHKLISAHPENKGMGEGPKHTKLVFEADLSPLKNKKCAVIGYGNQGRAQAHALRRNGIDVVVGNIKDEYWELAAKEGFKTHTIGEAAQAADVLFLLIPDEVAPEVYRSEIEPAITKKDHVVLDFASGYNITYGFITPPPNADVVMVAPRMIGTGVLERVEKGAGYPVLVGVAQDKSGKAWEYALAIAKGVGALQPGGVAVLSSFEEETLLDLFSEHVIAPLILFGTKAAAEILVKEFGTSVEATLLELYASGEWAEVYTRIYEEGLFRQEKHHSTTSQYGTLSRGERVVTNELRETMRREAKEILDGSFAKEWAMERLLGYPHFNRLWKMVTEDWFAKAEEELYRALKRGREKTQ